MKFRKAIDQIREWGISGHQESYLQKKIVLTNEISLLLAAAVLVTAIPVATLKDPYLLASHFGLLGLAAVTLLLNKGRYIHFSRYFISFTPIVVLLASAYFSRQTIPVNYIIFSYAIIGFNLVPLLIFNFLDEKKRFIAALGFNLLFLMFYDRLLLSFEGSTGGLPDLLAQNYFHWKGIQVVFWFFIVVSVMFVKRINKRYEARLEQLNRELEETNREISTQNEEIAASNEELISQQDQIVEQRKYIETQNKELLDYQGKLLNYVYKLSKTNSKLSRKQAENKSILSALRQNFIMMEFDLQGKVSGVTEKTCSYLGVDRKAILQKKVKEILKMVPGEDSAVVTFEDLWDRMLVSEAVYVDFEFIVGKKGVFVSTTLAPILDENGESVKILAIAEDISDIIAQQKVIESKNALLEKQQEEIRERNEELLQQKEEIEIINENLEHRVKERTMVLEQKNRQLAEYAFINAHLLRAPVSSILGLVNLMGLEKLNPREQELYKYLKESAHQLDKIVFRINRAIEMNREFDREFLKE